MYTMNRITLQGNLLEAERLEDNEKGEVVAKVWLLLNNHYILPNGEFKYKPDTVLCYATSGYAKVLLESKEGVAVNVIGRLMPLDPNVDGFFNPRYYVEVNEMTLPHSFPDMDNFWEKYKEVGGKRERLQNAGR